MFVVGVAKAEYLGEINKIFPHRFSLVSEVGVQGLSLSEVCQYGMNTYYFLYSLIISKVLVPFSFSIFTKYNPF